MAWAILESNKDRGSIEKAISDFETAEEPTSIDYISTTVVGVDRVTIQVVYTE